jgi:prepilin-type N-terminal cleavage/methylation domain-containing protein
MKNKGFTLIELLVTMGIIAVLSGMAIFNFNQSRMRARDVQRKSDLSQMQKALELYRNDNNGIYPISAGFPDILVTGGYSKILFVDPKGSGWYTYIYVPGSGNKTYAIGACLENKADGTRASGTACSLIAASCSCGTLGTGVLYVITNP